MGKVILTIVAGLFIMAVINSGDQEPTQSATAETSDQASGSEAPPQTENKPDPEPKPAPPPPSPWSVHESTSEIDDSKSVYLRTFSLDTVPNRFGTGGGKAQMLLRCLENTTTLQLNFNDQFMADIQSYGRVTFRLDSDPAFKRSLHESTNNEWLGLWSGGRSIPVIKRMFGHEQLTVRATPYNQSSVTVTFPIRDLAEEIKPLREACHW
ncbi:type VI secretion system-associated protein TagO [Halomonas sp. I1]|uniref:type VI secretion system-associated protein TagO n=1 Tax=Halomonas sp. I1 TaxID=393536 RepID=UPI0028E02981|nr:type VI secretion system-associated protein TagO [Halomonas sp. I1]MDT8895792.1 type VI secretion system-associated protein TagO [Halomonas sp. I1]